MTPDAEFATELMKVCGIDPAGVSRVVLEITKNKTTLAIERRRRGAGVGLESVLQKFRLTAVVEQIATPEIAGTEIWQSDSSDMSNAERVVGIVPSKRYVQQRPVSVKPYVILARTMHNATEFAKQLGIPNRYWRYLCSVRSCEGLSNVKVLFAPGFDTRSDAEEMRRIIDFGVNCAGVEIVDPETLLSAEKVN